MLWLNASCRYSDLTDMRASNRHWSDFKLFKAEDNKKSHTKVEQYELHINLHIKPIRHNTRMVGSLSLKTTGYRTIYSSKYG